MKIKTLHSWDVSYQEAIAIQNELITKLKIIPFKKKISLVAGTDVSYSKDDRLFFAGVVVLKYPEMEIIERQNAIVEERFPYVPGFLAFREIPGLCYAFEKVKNVPDVVICDGQGIAHPRGLGLASHLGLILNLPTIGCAKKRLVGEYASVSDKRWSRSSLKYQGKKVGTVLRTREKVKPVYISPGHKIDFQTSVDIIKKCVSKYRLPVPVRCAHLYVNQIRQNVPTPNGNI